MPIARAAQTSPGGPTPEIRDPVRATTFPLDPRRKRPTRATRRHAVAAEPSVADVSRKFVILSPCPCHPEPVPCHPGRSGVGMKGPRGEKGARVGIKGAPR
jgi:hypothetical protein